MNNIYKYMSLGLGAWLITAVAVSCDDSKNSDYVSEYTGEPGIYFSPTADSYLEIDPQKSTFVYQAYRDVGGPEVTVPLYVQPVGNYAVNLYTFPDAVTFPQGSKTGDIVISYNSSQIEIGEEQQYELTLGAQPNPFSGNSVIITLVNPAPWQTIGTNGMYFDYLLFVDNDYSNGPAIVTVEQRKDKPNYFRISNPYIGINDQQNTYFNFQILEEGEEFFGVTVNQPNLVGFSSFEMGFISDLGGVVDLMFMGRYEDFRNPNMWIYNAVTEYQDNGLPGIITLCPIYSINDNQDLIGDLSGPQVFIYFPNYTSKDTSLEVNYEGTLVTNEQQEYVLIDATLGSDLTTARAAVSSTLSGQDLYDAIENGSIDYVTTTTSGSVRLPFENQPTGNYTVGIVGYNGEMVKNTASTSFYYVSSGSAYDPNEGWNPLGMVDYTDGYIVSGVFTGTDKITYKVELQESETDPGIYRLVNPYGTYFASFFVNNAIPPTTVDVPPYYIIIDARNTSRVKVLQTPQPIVFYFPDEYGLMYTWSWADMYEQDGVEPYLIAQEGLYGKLTNGRITFPPYTLYCLWSDEPDEWYSANYALNYEKFEAGDPNPVYTNAAGVAVAPFCVDLNSLEPSTQTINLNPQNYSGKRLAPSARLLMKKTHHIKKPSKEIKPTFEDYRLKVSTKPVM